jgi:hypothetical protein
MSVRDVRLIAHAVSADNDGLLDLYVQNGLGNAVEDNELFINTGNGAFTAVSGTSYTSVLARTLAGGITATFYPFFFDLNNDGYSLSPRVRTPPLDLCAPTCVADA